MVILGIQALLFLSYRRKFVLFDKNPPGKALDTLKKDCHCRDSTSALESGEPDSFNKIAVHIHNNASKLIEIMEPYRIHVIIYCDLNIIN